ncbi:hypothetical protein C9374_002214 [Naegleria lovaniensis]|uniref:Uncharacterized protein n=1 Tax=Naegleria lovaniensis TaxID=51637 RepID=A0AA88KK75_NAELO|nr:uncharacterized protein C9374_002214 [Naegleria lovaniensis]KAG2386470.1 hypothetical protein C9374_002214 [Naegleria lovaniensis]
MKPLFLYISLGLFAGFEILQSTSHVLLLAVAAIFREFAVSTDSHLLMTRSVMFLALATFLLALVALKIVVWLVGARYMYQMYRQFTTIKTMTYDHSVTREETQSINHHGREDLMATPQNETTRLPQLQQRQQFEDEEEINIYNSNNTAFRFLWNFRKTSARFLNLFIFSAVTLSLTSLILCVTLSFLFLMYYSSVDLVYFSCTAAIIISLLSLPLNAVLFFHSCYNESFAQVDSLFSLNGSSSSSSASSSNTNLENSQEPPNHEHEEEQANASQNSKKATILYGTSNDHEQVSLGIEEEEEEIVHVRKPLLNPTTSVLDQGMNVPHSTRQKKKKQKKNIKNGSSSSKPIAIQDSRNNKNHTNHSSIVEQGEDISEETTSLTVPGERSQF